MLYKLAADGSIFGVQTYTGYYGHQTHSLDGRVDLGVLLVTSVHEEYNEGPNDIVTVRRLEENTMEDTWNGLGCAARFDESGENYYVARGYKDSHFVPADIGIYQYSSSDNSVVRSHGYSEVGYPKDLAVLSETRIFLAERNTVASIDLVNDGHVRWTYPMDEIKRVHATPDSGCVVFNTNRIDRLTRSGQMVWSFTTPVWHLKDVAIQPTGAVLFTGNSPGYGDGLDSLLVGELSSDGTLLWNWLSPEHQSGMAISATEDGGCVIGYLYDQFPFDGLAALRLQGRIQLTATLEEPVFLPAEGGELHLDVEVEARNISGAQGTFVLQGKSAAADLPELELEGLIHSGTNMFEDVVYPVPEGYPSGHYQLVSTLKVSGWQTSDSSDFYLGTSGVDVELRAIAPVQFLLQPVYPNPFNSTTTISFDLNRPTPVNLSVFDLLGREVTVLSDGQPYAPGSHRVVWDASGLPGGTYFLRAQTDDEQQVRRMLFLK